MRERVRQIRCRGIFQRDHRRGNAIVIGESQIEIRNLVRLLDRYVAFAISCRSISTASRVLSRSGSFSISATNISPLSREHIGLGLVAHYYATQVPQIFIILLPVSLLLGLLFTLGRMSRANEIVSMLTAGISLPRVLLPLIAIGLFTVGVSMALNYSLAPHAELARKAVLSEARGRPDPFIEGQIFRNRTDLRTWFIQNFRLGSKAFNNVQVLQQDANDNIVTSYTATRALSCRDQNLGSGECESRSLRSFGNRRRTDLSLAEGRTLERDSFRLGSANVRAEFLKLAELRGICISIPIFPPRCLRRSALISSIVSPALDVPGSRLYRRPRLDGYSRRGVLSSVAAAVVLFSR
jgi:hypothetical protein